MESNATSREDEDEYILLDLDGVCGLIDIPPNANYVLTGLDTLNPVLIIDDRFKLVGEYEETIGTCIAFSEQGIVVAAAAYCMPVNMVSRLGRHSKLDPCIA
ncbi:hypothetical protein P8452_57149 [Trifolium repens]|nr:hypothetical protein P8452_57149 [Trifolium repens]